MFSIAATLPVIGSLIAGTAVFIIGYLIGTEVIRGSGAILCAISDLLARAGLKLVHGEFVLA
ncbi:hypothetical protein B1790_02935 [Mycobacterium sp. AT1]|nr:hypothetical protein B1790_02935 [Mycobacterium sp. AT1]